MEYEELKRMNVFLLLIQDMINKILIQSFNSEHCSFLSSLEADLGHLAELRQGELPSQTLCVIHLLKILEH